MGMNRYEVKPETAMDGLFAESEADEAGDGDGIAEFLAFLFEEFGDGDVGIFYEALLNEAGFGEEFGDLSFEDVFEDVFGFALFEEADAEDFAFGIDDFLRDVLAGEAFGGGSGDVEGEVLDEFLEDRG